MPRPAASRSPEKHFAEEKKKREQRRRRPPRRKQKTLADAAAHARAGGGEAVQKGSRRSRASRQTARSVQGCRGRRQAGGAGHQAPHRFCRQIYFALPDEFKEKIGANEPADWTTATYPDRHDITELSTQAHGLDAVKRKLRGAQDEARKVSELRAKLESARERFTRAQATIRSGDSSGLREEFNAKTAEEKAVASNIAATKKAISGSEIDVDRQQRDLNAIDRELTEINGKLELEQSSRKQSGEAVERAKKSLPVAWQQPAESAGLAERGRWQDEFDDLTNRGVEKKFTDLQAARGGLDSLRAEIAQFQQEVEVFPREARRAADEVRAEIATARQELDARNTELLDAQRAKGMLDDYRRQRGQLSEEYKTVDTEFHRYKLLAELLGRDRLQRFLVRKAERQIVDYANAVLDRLSGGSTLPEARSQR